MNDSRSGRKTIRRFLSILLCMIVISCTLATGFVSAGAFRSASDYSIGDEFLFGHYEQDNDTRTSAKKEDIAWIIIDIDDDNLLLLSKYALDNIPYQSNGAKTTWSTSRLREWLNGVFLKTAFTSDEIDMIVETTLDNPPNHKHYKVDSGSITNDKVFLLSEYEASDSYTTKDIRKCVATKYAQGRGTWTDCDDLCAWWLRTLGCSNTSAMYVGTNGNSVNDGFNVSKLVCGVRPAIWVDLSKAK